MASGTYTAFTLADALADMGSRLFDPNHVRWPAEELTIYVQQAIRTYNAFTNHFRDQAAFDTTNKQAFYDLGTVAPDLRAMTFTVRDAVDEILWHLLEPPLRGNLWTGTQQYALNDVLSALQQARDTFLLETGIVVTRTTQTVTPGSPNTGIVDLDETIIAVRRAAWTTPTGITAPLRREDQWGLVNYRVGWQTPRTASPLAYSVSAQPPLQLQIAPTTTATGTLDILTVNRGVDPNLLETQPLGVPNDWCWVVIFGALAQLFQRDGLAVDPFRAEYCQSRWTDGLTRAKMAGVVLSADVNGTWTPLGSVPDADAYASDWQVVSGVPKRVLTVGHTLIGLWPPAGIPPAGGSYTVTLDVVRNAPVPVDLSDPLQVGNETLNDLLDYAQHLALIKEGPGQVQAAMGLLNQFAEMCGTTVAVQMGNAASDPALLGQTPQDQRMHAYQES